MHVDSLLHHLLRTSAAMHPERVAVENGDETITYAELEAASNRLANLLSSLGARRGDRVALYLDKSIASVIAVYGIMKTGSSYVPLDPGAPPARLAYILVNAGI